MDQNQSPPAPAPPPKSAIPRRGPTLAAIRTDIAQQSLSQQQQQPQPQPQQQQQQLQRRPVLQKSRPQRPRPPEPIANQQYNVPLQSEPPKKVSSKSSLRSLFARSKALREERKTDVSLPTVGERRGSTTPSTTVPDTPRSVAPTLASESTIHASPQVATPAGSTFSLEKSSKPTTKTKPEIKSKATPSWAPPPLFQAYPQALKHARLAVPNISTETLLRLQATRSEQASDGFHQGEKQDGDNDAVKKNKKDVKDKRPAKRGESNALDQIILLKKIFVLVTSGYLLQYSGEGNYARLPEKVMRLGAESAAFASDAIPGRHYVVNITQKSTPEGTVPPTPGRKFLSRFGLQTAESRRAVRTLLVVMPNAHEMNSWLITLRKTIETLGGKKFAPELADNTKDVDLQGDTILAHRGSRLLISRNSSLKESLPSSLPESSSRQSPAPSSHRKSLYQDEDFHQQQQERPRIPSPVKKGSRLSISSPLDPGIEPGVTSKLDGSDVIFESPRDAPRPIQRSKGSSNSPPTTSSAVESATQSPASGKQPSRRSSTSVSHININRRSLTMYAANQLERQREIARTSRPLSYIDRNSSNTPDAKDSVTPRPDTTAQPAASGHSLMREDSSQSLVSSEGAARKASVTKTVNKTHENVPEILWGSASLTRQSMILQGDNTSSTIPSTTPSSGNTTIRHGPIIPPRKYSLTRTESSESVAASSGHTRYYQTTRLPDVNHTPRLPSQRLAQLNHSRLPSSAEKGNPSARTPKTSNDTTEPRSSTSTPVPGSLPRFALGKSRFTRVPAAASKTPEVQNRNIQQIRQSKAAASSDETALRSKSSTPASSPQTPQTPQTPREEISSRRSSIIASQSQLQQPSPRTRRNPNLSLLPPAPPPNVPLPEAPPLDTDFRHKISLRQRRHLQEQTSSQPPQTALPQPPPVVQRPQQQTHPTRPSLSTSVSSPLLTTAASSASIIPRATANPQHTRRRSSELRSLHLQMANMLHNSIMHRKQSDANMATSEENPDTHTRPEETLISAFPSPDLTRQQPRRTTPTKQSDTQAK